ncbi:Protein CBR-HIPR-1 [Caenorhabditis briggsae]|uniref:Protein CBR-HIPR-1 n=1 Tax=Caenorhabditis briggsae TaxID=6238 RepID=A8XLZ9_CAEBR|nr:Protein CBR-HIPR-1 [Caenorhabditis briggsae]CAP33674.2 Protein CBR-HIPR-1 [Caenorhabditis briggsae]
MDHRAQLREAFVRGQLEAVQKAITKNEVPLKPKHARTIIVGTHKEKSSGIFWHTVGRIQLEKHPVLTWKFCHLVHKMLRDGYRKVPEETYRFVNRFTQLSQFWKHLNTSGYGPCIEAYCKLIHDRVVFHNKYPVVPGKLDVNDSQLKTLEGDLDNMFEMTIDMLDQMDALLMLQDRVFEMMNSLRWNSLIPQGQCMLSPLIIAVLDTSKFYDYLVKMIFKLHSQVPPDALEGHRSRFRKIFERTKKFYEEASALQYFKYLVSIPTLPSKAPNFLQQSDLESYRTPHAYLHSEGSEDGTSLNGHDGELLNLAEEEPQQASPSSLPDPREEQIVMLTRAVEDEKFAKERLLQEARNRIEQYENRLLQMQGDLDHAKREADENREESTRIKNELALRDASKIQSDDAQVKQAEAKATAAEERFQKMKGVYDKFRSEHVVALTKLGDLQKQLDASEKAKFDKEEEITALNRKVEEAQRETGRALSKAEGDAGAVDEMRTQLAKADIEVEELKRTIDHLREKHANQLVQSSAEEANKITVARQEVAKESGVGITKMFDHCEEELQNATSITYPPLDNTIPISDLAQAAMTNLISIISSDRLDEPLAARDTSSLVMSYPLRSHPLLQLPILPCKKILATAKIAFADDSALSRAEKMNVLREDVKSLLKNFQTLNTLIVSLPLATDIDKEVVGSELEQEMRRMDDAIRRAVQEIEAIQRKARENSDGIRLEVNESILANCQALMSVIMQLVAASRELQIEIVAAGKQGGSPAEFYKRNHQWTEGLLSAAKAVGVAARVLVESADGVVTGKGKFEHLIVAAQEIAASTAQLFVSSRVKADKDSSKLEALSIASKAVNQNTAQVVAAVKNGQTTLNDDGNSLDFSYLSLHAAKKEEMESQVRMLELEQSLNQERAKLAALRKQHYHMAQLVANKEDESEE